MRFHKFIGIYDGKFLRNKLLRYRQENLITFTSVIMLATQPNYKITWEKLPDDFVLPDDPVDGINQPTLATGGSTQGCGN